MHTCVKDLPQYDMKKDTPTSNHTGENGCIFFVTGVKYFITYQKDWNGHNLHL